MLHTDCPGQSKDKQAPRHCRPAGTVLTESGMINMNLWTKVVFDRPIFLIDQFNAYDRQLYMMKKRKKIDFLALRILQNIP